MIRSGHGRRAFAKPVVSVKCRTSRGVRESTVDVGAMCVAGFCSSSAVMSAVYLAQSLRV